MSLLQRGFKAGYARGYVDGLREGKIMEPKKGYKTTEFWLSAAAVLGSLLVASGALEPDTAASQAVALVLSALAAMGYTGARSLVKNTETKARALKDSSEGK